MILLRSRYPLRDMLQRLSLCGLVLLLGCGPAGDAPSRMQPVTPLAPPAKVGSGEPNLSSFGDAVLLSWLERSPAGGHDLWMAALRADGTWDERRHVVHGDSLFVNWADFPSVSPGGDGRLWAHWLERRSGGGLAYDIRVASSADGGASWSEPWTPHEDGTPTEHGFVTLFPTDDGVGMVWLDGRLYAQGPDGGDPTREMTIRARMASGDGPAGPEMLVDARSCDCCQTDAARTPDGMVVVYRDRSEGEVRDILVTRETASGWTEGVPVHEDGWVIGGCPVNGPAIDAAGARVAVAWFTGAGDRPRVHVAFSDDGGATFGAPVHVDGGNPAGRVDVRMRPDGSALVSWMERTGGEGAELRLAAFGPGGAVGDPIVVSSSSAARASGFPRMVTTPWNPEEVLLAWTDVADAERPQVRAARVQVPVR